MHKSSGVNGQISANEYAKVCEHWTKCLHKHGHFKNIKNAVKARGGKLAPLLDQLRPEDKNPTPKTVCTIKECPEKCTTVNLPVEEEQELGRALLPRI